LNYSKLKFGSVQQWSENQQAKQKNNKLKFTAATQFSLASQCFSQYVHGKHHIKVRIITYKTTHILPQSDSSIWEELKTTKPENKIQNISEMRCIIQQ